MVSKKSGQYLLVVGLILGLAVNGFGADSSVNSSSDELLSLVPADSLFCVRINDFDKMFAGLDQYLAGVSPMPLYMMARMQLASLVGDPTLGSVNMNGNFAIIGVAGAGSENTEPEVLIGGLIPFKDFEGFRSGNTNCSEPDENGICKLTGSQGTMLLASLGSYVFLTNEDRYNQFVSMLEKVSANNGKGLAEELEPAELVLAVTEPIWAYGSMQQAKQAFGPMIDAGIMQMKSAFAQMQAEGGSPMDMMGIMNMYEQIFTCLINETKHVTISLNPQPTVCNITTCTTALPGSELASILVSNPAAAKGINLLGYLEDSALMNCALRMDSPLMQQLYIKSMDLYSLMVPNNANATELENMKKIMMDWITASGDSAAFTVNSDPAGQTFFSMKYISSVKDPAKFEQVLDEYMKLMDSAMLKDFYQGMGMEFDITMQPGVETYKGVTIDSGFFAISMTDPNSPQAQMIDAMYGGGFEFRWAVVDQYCVEAVGGDVEKGIHELIDDVQAGPVKPVQPGVQAALNLIPDALQNDFVGTFNVVNMMNMVGKMFAGIEEADVPFKDMNFTSQSNIVFAGTAADGTMRFEAAVPKEHLQELMQVIQTIQQLEMQKQQESAPAQQEPQTF